MRILALSDAYDWSTQAELLNRHRPDVTILAGDLVSDGIVAFRRAALEAIPAYRRERDDLLRRYPERPRPRYRPGVPTLLPIRERRLYDLQDRYRESPAYHAARRRLHVRPFYEFLAEAGRMSQVLVVKGNHDDDYPGEYRPDRISRIPGCREISGQAVTLDGHVILGIGSDQAWRLRSLDQVLADWRGRVDVVIAHAPRRNIAFVTALSPRLIIRGHYGPGPCIVNGVPTIGTWACPTVITMRRRSAPLLESADPDSAWIFTPKADTVPMPARTAHRRRM